MKNSGFLWELLTRNKHEGSCCVLYLYLGSCYTSKSMCVLHVKSIELCA